MTAWSDESRAVIKRVAATLPNDMPCKERKAAISAAYPFGPREYWPYKAWLKASRAYLTPFDPKTPAPAPLFPNLRRDPVTGRPVIE